MGAGGVGCAGGIWGKGLDCAAGHGGIYGGCGWGMACIGALGPERFHGPSVEPPGKYRGTPPQLESKSW